MTNYSTIMSLETTDRRGMELDLEEAHDAIILEFARSKALQMAAQKKASEVEKALEDARIGESLALSGATGESSWQANNGPAFMLSVNALSNRLTILRMLGYGEKPATDFGLITLSDAFHALVA